MFTSDLLNHLFCPQCLVALQNNPSHLTCPNCQTKYTHSAKSVVFYSFESANNPKPSDSLLVSLKNKFKHQSSLYHFFYYLLGALFVGPSAKQALADLGKDKLIINLGSGPKRLRPDIINLDFLPLPNVDIIADINHLPFASATVDAIVAELVLEHVPDPQATLAEIKRVLKPGGLIYLVTPFIENFHSSPGDYTRWTKSGLRALLVDFEEKEIGIRCGPASAFAVVAQEFFSLLLSFGWQLLQQFWSLIFLFIFSPLKLFDLLLSHFPGAENIALAFYYLGKKK